jgi:hypothetical protein
VNEFGVRCPPYLEKSSTISDGVGWFDKEIDRVGWFDKEIKALSATIAKVNKNFVCFVVARVLRTLCDNGCGHVEGLQTIMSSRDASISEDPPEEITKLTGHLVRKWWVKHGLPHVTEHFHITSEVRIFFCL